MPFGATIPEEILVEPVRQEACPPSLYPFRRLLAKGPLQRTPWALPRVSKSYIPGFMPAGQNEEFRRPSPSRAQPSPQPASEKAKPTKKGGSAASEGQGMGRMANCGCVMRYQSMQLTKPAAQLHQAARLLRLPKRTRAT